MYRGEMAERIELLVVTGVGLLQCYIMLDRGRKPHLKRAGSYGQSSEMFGHFSY